MVNAPLAARLKRGLDAVRVAAGAGAILAMAGLPGAAAPAAAGALPGRDGNGPGRVMVARAGPAAPQAPAEGAERLRERPSASAAVEEFGAVGDGVADDAAAFNAGLAAVAGAGGGTLVFGRGPYLVDGADLAIPANVHLRGAHCVPGGERIDANYEGIPGTIVLDPARTITGGIGARLSCGVLKRKGLRPPFAQAGQAARVRALLDIRDGMSGTAVKAAGQDFTVEHMLILGFGQCLDMSGFERPLVRDVNGDCTNGLNFDGVHDIGTADRVEFFPFLTTELDNATDTRLAVTGAAGNGRGEWRLTLASPIDGMLRTGDVLQVAGASTGRGMNGRYAVAVVDATHVDLQDSTVRPRAATGEVARGSSAVDGVAPLDGIRIGMAVAGPGIAAGSTVADLRSNRVVLSAPATATVPGAALSFADSPYTTGDGILYVNTNLRVGTAFNVVRSEAVQVLNSFEYGWDVGAHTGDGAFDTHFVNFSADNFRDPAEPYTAAMVIDGTAIGTSWIGGFTSSYGTPLVVNSRVQGGNLTAHMVSGVTLNPNSNASHQRISPVFDLYQGRLILQGVKTNVLAGSTMQVGSANFVTTGPSPSALLVSGSDLQGSVFVPFNASARAGTRAAASFGTNLP